MRFLVLFILALTFTACRDSVKEEDLKHLNGYWEIEKVVFQDGNQKEYNINLSIDYFEYNNFKGFRKKVQPTLDGSYITSDDAEFFEISTENNTFNIEYRNDLSSWVEEIRLLSNDKMILVNSEGLNYHYRRFEPVMAK